MVLRRKGAMSNFPIDRILFETTEFCRNLCYFCYGDYGPQGKHMSPQQFKGYLSNLVEMDLVDPKALLILFGGEFLNHPQSLEICRIAAETVKPTMRLVVITSGKYRDEYKVGVEEMMDRNGLFHHWEVSIKDSESFQFALRLFEKGQEVLLRYDYLRPTDLKNCMERFFQNFRLSGKWKAFQRHNPRLQKELRYFRQVACEKPDTVIVEEFFYPDGGGEPRSVGLTFSPLDRSVMRKGSSRAEARCSLFNSQYQKAIHLSFDGTIFPCHLPRYKKRCQALGNAADTSFLKRYKEKIDQFRKGISALLGERGICIEGCRGKIASLEKDN